MPGRLRLRLVADRWGSWGGGAAAAAMSVPVTESEGLRVEEGESLIRLRRFNLGGGTATGEIPAHHI